MRCCWQRTVVGQRCRLSRGAFARRHRQAVGCWQTQLRAARSACSAAVRASGQCASSPIACARKFDGRGPRARDRGAAWGKRRAEASCFLRSRAPSREGAAVPWMRLAVLAGSGAQAGRGSTAVAGWKARDSAPGERRRDSRPHLLTHSAPDDFSLPPPRPSRLPIRRPAPRRTLCGGGERLRVPRCGDCRRLCVWGWRAAIPRKCAALSVRFALLLRTLTRGVPVCEISTLS